LSGVIYTILTVIFCALQTTVFEHLKLFGTRPNLLIALVVCVALAHGALAGGAVGLLCGVVSDIMGCGVFGINSLLMMYLGAGIGFFSSSFYRIRSIVVFIFAFAASFTYKIIYYFLVFYIWGKGAMLFAVVNEVLPGSLYTAIASVFIIKIIQFVNGRFSARAEV